MPLESIRLWNYRNLLDAVIPLSAHRIFLLGDNGQGKTNLLEAIYYSSVGSSFRGAVDASIPRLGSKSFSISASIKPDLSSRLPPEHLEIRWASKVKTISREGKPIRDRKDLIGLNPTIVYSHEDFSFAAGEPDRRRFFFDQTASLISSRYIDLLRDFRKVLHQRNAALKLGSGDLLDVLDWQFAELGKKLCAERSELASKVSPLFSRLFEEVQQLGETIRVAYSPSWSEQWPNVDATVAALHASRREECANKTSMSGPQRDRWLFMKGNEDYTKTASTGQLRALSLVLRSCQALLYLEQTGRNPVLLLDDVLLELDSGKKAKFLQTLPASSQAVFTFLPGESWISPNDSSSLVYQVHDGRFEE